MPALFTIVITGFGPMIHAFSDTDIRRNGRVGGRI
jgi:hypothetical protein